MKINWGTGIVLAFIAFITFILVLVVTMTTNKELDHDLVVEDYYKKELDFQHQLDKERNAQRLVQNIEVEKSAEGLLVHFPGGMDSTEIKGSLFLYRPSNKNLDFEVPISLSSHTLLIPGNRLVEGRWNLEIDWQYGQKAYYFEEKLTY